MVHLESPDLKKSENACIYDPIFAIATDKDILEQDINYCRNMSRYDVIILPISVHYRDVYFRCIRDKQRS